MRQYSEDLKFEAIDSTSGTLEPIDSTLALVNNSNLPDEEVREKVASFLESVIIDFPSDDSDAPRELPALYENDGIGYHCSIYAPRYTGRNDFWETFNLNDTNYSVMRAA